LQQLKPKRKRGSKKQISVQHHKPFLVYAYLGQDGKEHEYKDIAFIHGSGVCSGAALDMIYNLKGLTRPDYSTFDD
jgi:hypothetical protein